MTPPLVRITETPLSIEELLAVADGADVELDDDARATIAASRGVVDRMLEGEEPVYGLNTGVGHMKDVRLPIEELRSAQETLLMTHAGGTGESLSTERVRAAMAARLNGIARGGSGASPRVADVLVAMLNAGVHPIVPSRGSVGTGDLGQLAFVGQVAIGRARAELLGEILAGAEALRRAGIDRLRLEPKDGLTIMSSNAVAIGDAAFAVSRAERAAARAEEIGALSLEAVHGNPSIARRVVGDAKPFPGQIASCEALRAALDGGFLADGGAARSVQDPLSFRVIPQVHGAFRDALTAARRAVETELNSRSDNPLVSIEDDSMVHNGNFHPLVMGIAFDQLRTAIAHVGQISERRMSHLWDAFFERIGAGSSPPGREPPEAIGLSMRYPAAATFAELKRSATPATLDVPPLDLGVEDHATGAPLAVRMTWGALGLLEEILSIEVMMANDVLATEQEAPALGRGTATLAESARGAIDRLGDDRSPVEAQRAVAAELFP